MSKRLVSFYDIVKRYSDGIGVTTFDGVVGSIEYTSSFYEKIVIDDCKFDCGLSGIDHQSNVDIVELLKTFGITVEKSNDEHAYFKQLVSAFRGVVELVMGKVQIKFEDCIISRMGVSDITIPASTEFYHCELSEVSLSGMNLVSGLHFFDCEFESTNLVGRVIRDCTFKSCTFYGVVANSAIFEGCTFENIDYEAFDVNIQNTVFLNTRGIKFYQLSNFGTYSGMVTYIPHFDFVQAGCWSGSLAEFIKRCARILEDMETPVSKSENFLCVQLRNAIMYFIDISNELRDYSMSSGTQEALAAYVEAEEEVLRQNQIKNKGGMLDGNGDSNCKLL